MAGKPKNIAPAYQGLSTRDALIKAAHDLCEEMGAEHVKLREISRRVGIGISSVYNHFSSREELMAQVVRQFLERLLATFDNMPEGDPREQIAHICRTHTHVYAQQTYLTRLILLDIAQSQRVDEIAFNIDLIDQINGAEANVIAKGIEQGLFKPIDPMKSVMARLGATISVLLTYNGCEADEHRLAEEDVVEISKTIEDLILSYLRK